MKKNLRSSQPQGPVRRARRLNGQGPEPTPSAFDINAPIRRRRKNIASKAALNAGPSVSSTAVAPVAPVQSPKDSDQVVPPSLTAGKGDQQPLSITRDATTQTQAPKLRICRFNGEAEDDYAARAAGMIIIEHEGKDVAALLPDYGFSKQLQDAVRAMRCLREERHRFAEQTRLLTRFGAWSVEVKTKLIDALEDGDDQVAHSKMIALQRKESEARRDRQIIEDRVVHAEEISEARQLDAARALEAIFVECRLLPPTRSTFEKTSWDVEFEEAYSSPALQQVETVESDSEAQAIGSDILARIDAEQDVFAATQAVQMAQAAFNQRCNTSQHSPSQQIGSPVNPNESEGLNETTSEHDRRQLLTKMQLTTKLIEAERALQAAEVRLTDLQDSNHTPNSRTPTPTSFSRSSPPVPQPACLHRSPSHTRITSWRRSIPSSCSSSGSQPPLLLDAEEDQEDLPVRHKDNWLWGSISQATYHIQPNAYREKIEEWEKHCEELRARRREEQEQEQEDEDV